LGIVSDPADFLIGTEVKQQGAVATPRRLFMPAL
jgi:hypothetical protein